MKKSFLIVAVAALALSACKPTEPEVSLQVADFENITLASESVLHLNQSGTFESGDFVFQQEVSASDWGTYYYGNVVSNQTSNEYKGDYQNDMSAKGGAFAGKNFVVWTGSYVGLDSVLLKKAFVVPGMYVCNTPWVVDAIVNGDGMSDDNGAPFGADDYFTLTITGSLNGVDANSQVRVELAKGTEYIKDWTYVDLSSLGKVDALKFALTSSKKNTYGVTTPLYFAIDNLGAKK